MQNEQIIHKWHITRLTSLIGVCCSATRIVRRSWLYLFLYHVHSSDCSLFQAHTGTHRLRHSFTPDKRASYLTFNTDVWVYVGWFYVACITDAFKIMPFFASIVICTVPVRKHSSSSFPVMPVALLVSVLQYEIVSIFAYPWKSLLGPDPTSEAMIKKKKEKNTLAWLKAAAWLNIVKKSCWFFFLFSHFTSCVYFIEPFSSLCRE